MLRMQPLAIAGLGVTLFMLSVQAQERPDYRDFTLGSSLTRVLAQVAGTASDVTVVHQRPALIQELRWRTPFLPRDVNERAKDPVEQIVFSFSNDQLFRIAIDYDRSRTDGMTDADMIAALSERYGPPLTLTKPPTTSRAPAQTTGEWTVPVARWDGGEMAVVLLRRAFTAGFQVAITSVRLGIFATTAAAESIRLDKSEAPARELARQQQDAELTRLSIEKARAANKAAFRP